VTRLASASLALAAAIAGAANASSAFHPSASVPSFAPFITIEPLEPRVFVGGLTYLQARIVGLSKAPTIRWTLHGPGSIDADGDTIAYAAPRSPVTAIIGAAAATLGTAVTVRSVPPPPSRTPLLLVACYDRGEVDVRAGDDGARIGETTVAEQAGSVALEPQRRIAVVTARDRIAALDLTTMHAKLSPPVSGALFSQVVALAGGYFAVTDANANNGQVGIRLYRIDRAGFPTPSGGLVAGETPEGIVAERGGHAFVVSNINGNSILRFTFDGRGSARLASMRKTAARPFGMAIDERHRLLFVADNDTPALSGSSSRPGLETFALPGLQRRRPAVATGTPNALPLGVAVDEPDELLFVTNEGDATVAVYRLPRVRRIGTLRTGLTPWMPSVDASRRRLYVPSARSDAVDVFDLRRLNSPPRVLSTCSYPTGVAVDG